MGKFVIKKTKSGVKFDLVASNVSEFCFHLKASNGQIIAVSEGYKALDSCKNGIESVKKNASGADVVQE